MTDENPSQERRQYPRTDNVFAVFYDLSLPLPVNMNTDLEEYPAIATDLSEGGIGLDVDRPLAVDTTVKLRFELINGNTTTEEYRRLLLKLDGLVRHCSPRDKKHHRVGVQFLHITPEEQDFIAVYIKDHKLKQSP